jgi:UrcA family protein
MSIKSLLAAALSAAALAFVSSAYAGDEVIVRTWDGVDDVIVSETVRTDDLFLPEDAPILYDRLQYAADRACRLDGSYIEYLYGPARGEERLCRDAALAEAVAAIDSAALWAVHVDHVGPRAYAFY